MALIDVTLDSVYKPRAFVRTRDEVDINEN